MHLGTLLSGIARRWLFRPAILPAVVSFCALFVMALFAVEQNRVLYQEQVQSDVVKQLSVVRARLEGNVNNSIQLVRGLQAVIATEPDMDQSRFSALAVRLFDQQTQLRDIAAAPDLVVRMVYPLEENRSVIGLDYNKNPAQQAAANAARETGDIVFAGPVQLVQGGEGFIGRLPVFVGDGATRRFWGILSAVVDVERLYHDSGLFDPTLPIEIALSGRDGSGRTDEQFYGPKDMAARDPVLAPVMLPRGEWTISAVPKGGWPTDGPYTPAIWVGFGFLALLVCGPIVFVGRLLEERQRTLSALRMREVQLVNLSRRHNIALESSQVGVFELNLDNGQLIWDDRVNALYGLPQDGGERRYADWVRALHPDDRVRAEEDFRIGTEETGHYKSDFRVVTPEGETRSIRAVGAVYRETDGSRRIVGVNWDVSADMALKERLMAANRLSEARYGELEQAKARIEHNSLHDSLTGLPNRRYLDQWLTEKAAALSDTTQSMALLHIDLDRFKQINDTLGHAAGDAMLVHVAAILNETVSEEDFVARIGGDEFVVASADADTGRLVVLAGQLILAMRRPMYYEGHECRFGVSVGIAVQSHGSQGIDVRQLLINADIALYRAKSRGRDRYEFFTPTLQAEIVRTKRTADEILSGLERGEFEPFFQPQFDARSLEIVGMEALVRWNHPRLGLLGPAQFLDVAEDLNVVSAIDRVVLEKSLAHLRAWRSDGLAIPRISTNVSARRLQDEQLIPSLREMRIEPGTFTFELVESIFLDKTDEMVRWNIDQIKDLGIDVEIDDFGTGYASIVSLMQLKPRRLKIDKQLVKPIVDSMAQRRLLASIVDIGRSLGIEVLGEGVETMAHAEILRDLGCSALQGYVLARPMPAGEVPDFVRGRSWMPQVRRESAEK